jgi:hypothetical protein
MTKTPTINNSQMARMAGLTASLAGLTPKGALSVQAIDKAKRISKAQKILQDKAVNVPVPAPKRAPKRAAVKTKTFGRGR